MVEVVCAGMVFHKYVAEPIPPVTETEPLPLADPKQETSADVVFKTKAGGSVNVIRPLALQNPLLTVTV